MGIEGYRVTDHAWKRWLERSRSKNRRRSVERIRRYMREAQRCWPKTESKRRRKDTEYYTGGGYVFVTRDRTVVTVYTLSLNEFEV